METVAVVFTILGWWALMSVTAFFVFGEDVNQSYTCGQTTKGHIQTAAIIGFPPAMAGLIVLVALLF